MCASACVCACVCVAKRQAKAFQRAQDTRHRTRDTGHRTKDTEPAHRRHIHSFDVDATFAVVNGVKMNLCTGDTVCAVCVCA